MNKLDLCPLQSSYSVKYGTSVERIELRGGFGRYVQTKNAKKHLVDVEFTLREDDFIYFRAFFLNWQLNPLPFLMSLIIEDSEFREYIAQFIPDSFAFSELNGLIFKVSAQLVVVTTDVKILTSKPYQVEHIEYMSVDMSIDDTVLKLSPYSFEDVSTNFNVDDVILRDIYSSANAEIEKLSIATFVVNDSKAISSGPQNKSYTADVEPLKITTFSVGDSVQKTLLIANTAEVQNVGTSFVVNDSKFIN